MSKRLMLALLLLAGCTSLNRSAESDSDRMPAAATTSRSKVGLVVVETWLDPRDTFSEILANDVEAYCVTSGFGNSRLDRFEQVSPKEDATRVAKVHFTCSGSSGMPSLKNATLQRDYGLRFLAPSVRNYLNQLVVAASKGDTNYRDGGHMYELACSDTDDLPQLPAKTEYRGSSIVLTVGTGAVDGQQVYVAETAGKDLIVNKFSIESGRGVGTPSLRELVISEADLKEIGSLSTRPSVIRPSCKQK